MAFPANDDDLLATVRNHLERLELKRTQLAIMCRFLVNRLYNLDILAIRTVTYRNEVDFHTSKMTHEDPVLVIDKAVVNEIFENTATVATTTPIENGPIHYSEFVRDGDRTEKANVF